MTPTAPDPIRVALADDHPLIRAGIRSAISDEPDLLLVGEASNGQEAWNLCDQQEVDVLVLDLSMPGPHPKETVTYLNEKHPHLAILILTAFDSDIYIKTLVTLGIKGYILKDEATDTLVNAIRAVSQGGTWFSSRAYNKITNILSNPGNPGELTARELEILALLKAGSTNKEAAYRLNLTERTIRFHVENIVHKLHVKNRVEAVAYAVEKGWIDL